MIDPGMRESEELVGTIRRRVIGPATRRWLALDNDYKSVAVACGLVGLVTGIDVQVPW